MRVESANEGAEFLTFRLGDEEYAVDILQVREIRANEPITHIAGAPSFVKGVINLRGTIVPIVDLRVKLGFDAPSGSPVVMILSISGRVVGVMVDAVNDVMRLAAGEIRPAPEIAGAIGQRFIAGIAPVGDRMLVVVDMERLMAADELALVAREAA
ncbi:MAG TPA: chemotaxis protein CheW [Usitatibacter sp.]|nr:chemotaxis protein CheW [Usitatibacter sp.]